MTIKFYTQAEEAEIKKLLLGGKTITEIATSLHKKFKRSKMSLLNKAFKIKEEMSPTKKIKKSPPISNTNIPKGMKLEFPASKISIENNKIIIYL